MMTCGRYNQRWYRCNNALNNAVDGFLISSKMALRASWLVDVTDLDNDDNDFVCIDVVDPSIITVESLTDVVGSLNNSFLGTSNLNAGCSPLLLTALGDIDDDNNNDD